jgi:hypothetical protein
MPVTVGCVRVRELRNCTYWHAQNAIQNTAKLPGPVTKFPAKAQGRKETHCFPLRLCAFAGEISLSGFGLLAIILCLSGHGNAKNRLTISISNPGEVKIDAETSPARSWSFRNAYANALGMAERIDGFRAFGASDQDVGLKNIAAGEFRANLDVTKISYSVKLSTPVSNGQSHVSWLADDRGYLMFADLVPLDLASFSVRFDLPPGWTAESSLAPDANGEFHVFEPLETVFFVGRSLRKTGANLDGADFDIVLSGKWSFKDSEALKVATRVMQKYLAITQFKLPGKSIIMIAAPPITAKLNEWWAETRGSTVALLIEPRGSRLREQLTIILTHELLHLWVPNSLKLEGDYDWFFEGFTLYMALGMALELDVIDFKEFLNTLARAYDSYLSKPDDSSLLEASESRWTTSGSQVYVKGFLVAFLYDLLARKESGGKTTLADRYRELFKGGGAEHAQGNEVIIKLLGSSPALGHFAKLYIENVQKLELDRELPAYGLQLEASGKGSQLRVSRELSAEQKLLLRSLGYRK